ncbi:MAG: hypothetical protein R3D31_12510 [Hyphomicrobiaceae bacterium]
MLGRMCQLGLLALALVAAMPAAEAQRGPQRQVDQTRWVKLGTETVDGRRDRDVIRVGRERGAFDRIRLRVSGRDIVLREMRIVFANGDTQDVPGRIEIAAGTDMRPIRLDGGIRRIDRIELSYRARRDFDRGRGRDRDREQAVVEVWAEQIIDRPPPQLTGWELLGRDVVGPRVDREVIPVGRREGRFYAIRLRALRSDVYLHDLKVVYGNGEVDDIQVRDRIRAGDMTRPLALKGGRLIKEIRLVYASRPDHRARAIVEVWGDKTAQRPRPAAGIPGNWVMFGAADVGQNAERDVIAVGREKGRFSQIALRVRGSDVRLRRLRVVYANGETDVLEAREDIPAGRHSKFYNLKGDRFIKEIILVHRAEQGRIGRARVELFGLHAADYRPARPVAPPVAPPPTHRPGEWVILGSQKAGLGVDRDVITVGRDVGTFRKIRIDVTRSGRRGVRIYNVRVIYRNGESETLNVPNEIPRGGSSGPLDLSGNRRIIERIELVYRTKLSLFGETRVEVWGQR